MWYYKGISFEEIDCMQIDYAYSLYEFAVKKEANENLLKLNMMDYPNMSKPDRTKLFRGIKEIAEPIDKSQLKTTEDITRFLNG